MMISNKFFKLSILLFWIWNTIIILGGVSGQLLPCMCSEKSKYMKDYQIMREWWLHMSAGNRKERRNQMQNKEEKHLQIFAWN